MQAFTKHPHEQGVTYFDHWVFATVIACRLFLSAMAFAVHALMPFISIRRHPDLEATTEVLAERNRFIEAAASAD